MSEPKDISLSVSIVSFDTPQHILEDTLASLLASMTLARRNSGLQPAHLYLINNGSQVAPDALLPDRARRGFSEAGCAVDLFQGHGNIGFGSAHNLAINPTTARYHLILNPDVILQEDSLAEGIAFLEANPDVACIAPSAVGADGSKQHLCKRYPAVADLLVRALFPPSRRLQLRKQLAGYEMHDLPGDRPSRGIPIVSGCFMLCRSAALQQAGGFDERYFLYFEDFDLSLRLGKIAALVYLPSMRITHFGGNAAAKGWRHWLMFVRSGIRFFNTWGWRFL